MNNVTIPSTERSLSKVHPAFLDTTRKRVKAIEEYLSGDRSSDSLRATAKYIGLSLSRTGRLVRSYEIHRDPTLVSRERRSGQRRPATTRRAMVRDAVDAAITRLGTAAPLAAVQQAVTRSCEEASMQPPAVQLVWSSLVRARRENRSPATGTEPMTVVARLWLQLPVRMPDGRIERPEALVAMDLPSKQITACVTGLRLGRPPCIADLGAELGPTSILRVGAIEIGSLTPSEIGVAVHTDDQAASMLTRHLGNGIGELEVLFRRPRSDAQSLLRKGDGKALSIGETEHVIRLALLRHATELEEAISASPI